MIIPTIHPAIVKFKYVHCSKWIMRIEYSLDNVRSPESPPKLELTTMGSWIFVENFTRRKKSAGARIAQHGLLKLGVCI